MIEFGLRGEYQIHLYDEQGKLTFTHTQKNTITRQGLKCWIQGNGDNLMNRCYIVNIEVGKPIERLISGRMTDDSYGNNPVYNKDDRTGVMTMEYRRSFIFPPGVVEHFNSVGVGSERCGIFSGIFLFNSDDGNLYIEPSPTDRIHITYTLSLTVGGKNVTPTNTRTYTTTIERLPGRGYHYVDAGLVIAPIRPFEFLPFSMVNIDQSRVSVPDDSIRFLPGGGVVFNVVVNVGKKHTFDRTDNAAVTEFHVHFSLFSLVLRLSGNPYIRSIRNTEAATITFEFTLVRR